MTKRLYLKASRARRPYVCEGCGEPISVAETYYRDEPYPDDRRRGARVRQFCLACVQGREALPARGRRPRMGAPSYEPIGDGGIYFPVGASIDPPSNRLELLEDLLPPEWLSPSLVHVELISTSAGRIFEDTAAMGDLHRLDSRQLEELLGETLRRDGWETWITPRTGDGGRDVIACRPGVLPILLVGETKKMDIVEPLYLRSLMGVRDRDRAHVALLATTGRFSTATRQEANTWRRLVQLRDGDEFLAWVQALARRS